MRIWNKLGVATMLLIASAGPTLAFWQCEVPEIDGPAGVSAVAMWRSSDGVAVSDDLLMGAIAQHYGLEDAAVLALGAGVDVLLIAQNTTRQVAVERVIAAITRALAQGSLSERRIREGSEPSVPSGATWWSTSLTMSPHLRRCSGTSHASKASV